MRRTSAISLTVIVVILVTAMMVVVQWRQRGPAVSTPREDSLQSDVQTFQSLPVYPNATMVEDAVASDQPGLQYRTWETADDVPTVMRWYLEGLPQAGWTIVEYPDDPTSPGEQAVQLFKDGVRVGVIVENEGGQTEIVAYIHERTQ